MAMKDATVLLSLLVLTTNVNGQFYDVQKNYVPTMPTKITDFIIYPHDLSFPGNNQRNRETLSSLSLELEASIDSIRKKLSTDQLYSMNSYFTTSTPIRKTTMKTSHGQHINPNSKEPTNVNRYSDSTYKRKDSNSENKRPWNNEYMNNTSEKHTNKSTSLVDYSVTRPNYTTSRSNYATNGPNLDEAKPNFVTTRPKYMTNRPKSDESRPYTTTRNYRTTNAGFKPHDDVNYYTTPSTIRPGVKPANVDVNQPPITNRPSDIDDFPVQNDDPVRAENEDKNPEIIMGPDINEMSSDEKRRYAEMVERMCDNFKSANVKKVQAIPLVPSPEPVQVNVSVCQPAKVPLVVGGRVVTIQQFPHMALLGWTNLQGGGYSWKCGGSLISDRYVLTASHCTFQDKDDTVVTGAPRVVQLGSSIMDDRRALLVKVETAIRHPKYIRTRSYYDVALLKLADTVAFSDVVKPACLGDPPGADEPVIATGWGKTEFAGSQSLELRSVSVPVWDLEECRNVLGTSRKLPAGPSGDSQICAGEKQGGKDTCQGDSGGPAQIQDGCTWRIVAITSLGRSCGAVNTPALYATVHKAFIGAQIFGTNYDKDSIRIQYKTPDIVKQNNGNSNDNHYKGIINSGEETDYTTNHNTSADNKGNRNNNRHYSDTTNNSNNEGFINNDHVDKHDKNLLNNHNIFNKESVNSNRHDFNVNNDFNSQNINHVPVHNNNNGEMSEVNNNKYNEQSNNNKPLHNEQNNSHNLDYNQSYITTTSGYTFNNGNSNKNNNRQVHRENINNFGNNHRFHDNISNAFNKERNMAQHNYDNQNNDNTNYVHNTHGRHESKGGDNSNYNSDITEQENHNQFYNGKDSYNSNNGQNRNGSRK